MTAQVRSSLDQKSGALLPEVKTIVPVASGKGGVGKSTVSANLALALARSGASVGLLDADVYGPSIPTLMGVSEKPVMGPNNQMIPVNQYGVKVISMGFFLPQEKAVIWKGPMLDKMITQFLGGVQWGDLDYLIIDLPPGTDDIQTELVPEDFPHRSSAGFHASGCSTECGTEGDRHVQPAQLPLLRFRG